MAVHHATRKRVEATGATIAEDGQFVVLTTSEGDFRSTDPKALADLAQLHAALRREYPSVRLSPDADDPQTISVECGDEPGPVMAYSASSPPSLVDLLDDLVDAGSDPEGMADDEDEDEGRGSVVAESYKAEYKARTGAAHCGDWLALFLVEHCSRVRFGKKGQPLKKPEFSLTDFADLLTLNGIDPEKHTWGTNRTAGWQGRFRMSGRLALEQKILREFREEQLVPNLFLTGPTGDVIEIGVDRDWLNEKLAG